MTNMIITAGLSGWGIAALFAMAVIRSADERRAERPKRSIQLEVKS
jgi:hypothetical protein